MKLPWQKSETDLEREVQYHIETLADSYERQGLTRAAAIQQARREFGGVDRIKDECRDESVWHWVTHIRQDLTFGWRMMRKSMTITVAAVLSLALGIGATSAILTLADAVLWKTLGVPAPQQLTEIFWESKVRPEGLMRGSSGSAFRDNGMTVADFFSKPGFDLMRSRAAGKAEVAGHITSTVVSTSYEGAVVVARLRPVTGNFFPMLQVQPFLGRLLAEADDNPAASYAVVVTHRFWTRRLSANPRAVGQSISINNAAYTIAGVLPPTFLGIVPGEETDVYAPLLQSPQLLNREDWYRAQLVNPMSWWVQVIARRAPGVTDGELRAILDPAFAASWAARPKSPEATPHIRPADASHGLGSIRRKFGDPVWILLALVSSVLLVACANIANLLLARAASREKEVALRVSLGCGEGRLIRQFFTESLMLAALGGSLSVPVAALLGKLMLTVMPAGFDGMALSIQPDARSLAATAAITLFTALLFGLYPAWRAARVNASPALKEGSGSAGTMSRGRWAPAKALVLVQVSLGVLLVSAAIAFTTQLNEIVRRDAGFERGHVLLFDVRPGEIGYNGDRLRQFYLELEERLGSLPGVEAVALSMTRPMKGGGYFDTVRAPGQTKDVQAAIHHTSASFLNALGVPIAEGRAISAQEVRSGANVAVISENLAKELQPAAPLGLQIASDGKTYTVVGVARFARYDRLVQTHAILYIPMDYKRQSMSVILRTSIPPMLLLGSVRNAIQQMDRNLPLVDVFTMEQQIFRTLQRERMFAWLCGSFGVLALVLCVVGLYGLMSHTTARRTPEIGIRIALGAAPGDVVRQVLSEGMRLAAAGLVLGVPLAIYVASFAEKQKLLPANSLPYGMLAAAMGVLAISALAAVLAPAIRASSVDPIQALRRD